MSFETWLSVASFIGVPLVAVIWKMLNDKIVDMKNRIDDAVTSLDKRATGIGASLDELREQLRQEQKEFSDKYALKEDVRDFKNEMKRDFEKLNIKMDELLTEVRVNAGRKARR